jgi:hypothetical protein
VPVLVVALALALALALARVPVLVLERGRIVQRAPGPIMRRLIPVRWLGNGPALGGRRGVSAR